MVTFTGANPPHASIEEADRQQCFACLFQRVGDTRAQSQLQGWMMTRVLVLWSSVPADWALIGISS